MILAFPQTKADSVDCKSPTLLTRLAVGAVKFRETNKFVDSNTENRKPINCLWLGGITREAFLRSAMTFRN
jgi:hypothetical protein